MSVTIRHLNGDTTFLLIFSPLPHPTPSDWATSNSVFSILIDPWITGSSVVSARWFAVTDRVEPSAISHLSEIAEPDVVICSQNKPDHTHKETLLQLRPEAKTVIAAEPSAAKTIKSWNHFDPQRVRPLGRYDPRAKFGNSLRFYIPPLSSEGLAGEVVISFIPAKNYMTGLHNAIGITYQPPTSFKELASVATIDLPKPKHFHLPTSSTARIDSSIPEHFSTFPYHQQAATELQESAVIPKPMQGRLSEHRPRLSRASNTASSELLSFPYQLPVQSLKERPQGQPAGSQPINIPQPKFEPSVNEINNFVQNLPTPPDSPSSGMQIPVVSVTRSVSPTLQSTTSTLSTPPSPHGRQDAKHLSTGNKMPTIYPARPKAISILYTPHGITFADIKPYVQDRLTKLPGALPLTLLLHSFDSAHNPWYLGGNVLTGATGGIEIAKALMARCWISAHDEQKDDRGVAVKLLKTERMSAEDIRKELASDENGRKYGWICDVRSLPSGKELILSGSERDLLAGSTCEGVMQGTGLEHGSQTQNPTLITPG